jgi:hypothetical protein
VTELERLSELERKATAGPWTEWDNPVNGGEMNPDCQLMVALRNAFPALLAVVRAAEKWAEGKGDPRTLVDDLERAVAALSAPAGKEGKP